MDRSCLSPSEELLRVKGPLEMLPSAALEGQRVGHFRVRSPLGRGGMGVVYRAEDEDLRREVALKLLPLSFTGDEERRRRLLREARAAAAVNHPNIATVYEVGEANGRIYIAMELVLGKSLGQLLAAGKLSVDEALSVARQILRGLQKAHEAGLVHRDLKPDNVMITSDGVVKVLDFGLAKQRADAKDTGPMEDAETLTNVTAEGRILGTPLYMSPEQARGVTVDPRSDLFSFGVVLYEMLTDRRPFAGATMADVLTAILRDQPEPAAKVNPEVPSSLSRIVERCLAKDPGDRYPDGRSLMSELDRLFPMSGEGSNPFSSSNKAAPQATSQDERAARPKRAMALWKAGIGVALVGLAAVAFVTRPWQTSSPPDVMIPAPPSPRPTALTDLPLPTSKSPEAVVAYTQAVQAQRAGNWGLAEANLRRAVALDPLMTAAHLRLAMVPDPRKPTVENRTSYALAVQGSATLNERDQALLRAIEPLVDHEPPDHPLAAQRLRAVVERYPFDAELQVMLAYLELTDHEAGLRAARRGGELDPQYADAWQAAGEQLAAMDRDDESLQAFDRCIHTSPATSDCQGYRAVRLGALGRCAEMEEGLRHAISSNPRSHPGWYDEWANALHALGRPPETVLGVLEQKWAQFSSEDKRHPIELLDLARIDHEAGRFADAEARIREGSLLIRSDSNAAIHAWYARGLADIYRETGRLKEAAKVADEYLKRKDLWVGVSRERGATMLMLRTMLHAGALTKEAFAAARADWMAQGAKVGEINPGRLWLSGYVVLLDQREEAEEAIAALGALPPDALSPSMKRYASVALGQMYLLAGRTDEALAYLRPDHPRCYGFGEVPPDMPLGLALEQKGDKDGACAAYAAVLDRWGNAKPRSITAEKARAHAKALSCPERRPVAASGVPGLSNSRAD